MANIAPHVSAAKFGDLLATTPYLAELARRRRPPRTGICEKEIGDIGRRQSAAAAPPRRLEQVGLIAQQRPSRARIGDEAD